MLINGRNTGFKLTIGASDVICKLCPDNDLSRIGEVLDAGYSDVLNVAVEIMTALSNGYEEAQAYADPTHVKRPLTRGEVLAMSPAEFMQLRGEAFGTLAKDVTATVETESPKN